MNKVLLGVLAVSSAVLWSDPDLNAGHRRTRRCRQNYYTQCCIANTYCTSSQTTCSQCGTPEDTDLVPCTCPVQLLYLYSSSPVQYLYYAEYYYSDLSMPDCGDADIDDSYLIGNYTDWPYGCINENCELGANFMDREKYDGRISVREDYDPARGFPQQPDRSITWGTSVLGRIKIPNEHDRIVKIFEMIITPTTPNPDPSQDPISDPSRARTIKYGFEVIEPVNGEIVEITEPVSRYRKQPFVHSYRDPGTRSRVMLFLHDPNKP